MVTQSVGVIHSEFIGGRLARYLFSEQCPSGRESEHGRTKDRQERAESETGQGSAETGLGFGRPALDPPPAAGKSTAVAHLASQTELDEPAGGRQAGGHQRPG